MLARASYQLEAVIHRPPAEVFGYLSDLRHELEWNPGARRIVKVTNGPIGVGTRFQAEWRNAPRTLVEIIDFEAPHRWRTASRSWGMDVVFTGEVIPCAVGARYMARLDLTAHGLARLILPLAVAAMRRADREHMRRIALALSRDAAASPAVAPARTPH